MAIEILILSGVRQGERLTFESNTIHAGDRLACEIFFDSTRDRGAKGKFAVLQLREDGWYIRGEGANIVVNFDQLTTSRRIRSGDIIRLSPIGPDFSFHLITQAAAAKNLLPPAFDPATLPYFEPTPPPANHPADICKSPVFAKKRLRWNIWGSMAIAILFLLLLGVWLIHQDRSHSDVVTASTPNHSTSVGSNPPPLHRETPVVDVPSPPKINELNKPQNTQLHKNEKVDESLSPESETKLEPSPSREGKEPDSIEQLRDAVFLIETEDPKSHSVWPFATCIAVGDNLALTTAAVGSELAKLRTANWKVWIVNSTSGFKEPLDEVRIHRGYHDLREEPEKRIYFDTAILAIRGKFRKIATIASVAGLEELETGVPLVCLGIPHEGEIIDRFQSIVTKEFHGKVLIITSLPPSPGPRLLHVKATIPAHMYGSPFFNSQGEVVALYAEAAVLPQSSSSSAQTMLNLHYAPVLDPESLDAWTRDRNKEVWVEPLETPTKTPKTP